MHIIDQLDKTVRDWPEAVALRGQQGELSYRQFHDRIRGLCGLLQDHEIGEGWRVLIHLDRSFEAIIAIYAVLASGAAYVPVDTENPANRLEKIVRDASPALILSGADGEFLSQSANIARLDPSIWPESGPGLVQRKPNLAYIIYTSGSTGTPKGVAVGHRSLENYLAWALDSLPFNGGGVPLLGSVAFDHSVSCYFPPLLKGETLDLLPPLQGGKALARGLLTGRRYSYIKITPSHVRLLSIEQRAQMGRAAELIIFGGERVAPELVGDVRRDNPELTVMNHYGPTEATVGCCVFQLSPREAIPSIIPIGRPIRGVETVIQKPNGERAQREEPGELLVGGVALAEQYWGLADATASAFRTESFDGSTVRRWYHTGDVVKEMPGGNIEYLGRIDDQIKVLGHRIELREIEHAFRESEMVTDVVILTSDRGDEIEIVAAITPKLSLSMIESLRTSLKAKLPPVMVPSKLVAFDTLPVQASGKIDRGFVLQEAQRTESAGSEQTLEAQLLAQFRNALGIDHLGAGDDFFECGGDSMAAVEIIVWASAQFQISLDPAALFEHPSAIELARRIGELRMQNKSASRAGDLQLL